VGSILDLIRKPATTSAEMKEKLARLRAEDPAPRGADLELERRRLLFEGDDKAVDKIEAAIALNLRDAERYDTALTELETRIAAAEIAENAAALTAERDAVEAEAQSVAKLLATEYPKAANIIVSLLTRLIKAEQAVIDVNAKLVSAGREGERLAEVEWRVLDYPRGQYGEGFRLWNCTRLRGDLGDVAPGWPPKEWR
jgi:hypothetical protein